ncbi:MAG: transketolase family protein, partial [Mesorhizobium sp.]
MSADGLRGRRLGSTNYPRQSQLDNERILAAARQAGRLVVVAENHTVLGGLGE